MESISSSESSESSSSAELDPAPVAQSPLDLFRAFIVALVASINTHCNSDASGVASLAKREFETQAEGVLSDNEVEHAKAILAHVQHGPAPITAFPLPPEGEDSDANAAPAAAPEPYAGINTGQTFNGLTPNEESSGESSSSSESSSSPE